jgi:tRNA threonylcarbamoyladenosine modification (KEOPS) complex  Pcc1 subunit
MKVLCTLNLEFESAKKAKKIQRSIQIDDQKYVKSVVTRKTLKAIIKSTSVASLIHTLDDYLACISVADEIVKK